MNSMNYSYAPSAPDESESRNEMNLADIDLNAKDVGTDEIFFPHLSRGLRDYVYVPQSSYQLTTLLAIYSSMSKYLQAVESTKL